ncbi:MAG: restriction endonuclease subunit S [Rhodospirillaceae bacterium]|nr:restriction endonuclease subunit S [Rhodospirillaceae bacterium]
MNKPAPVHPPQEALGWPIKRNWRRLDALAEGVFDCPHSTPELTDRGPYVVRSQDIRSGVLQIHQMGRVSESTYLERIERAEPAHGDILYSREGTYFGIAAEIPKGLRLCLGQRMVLIRPDPSRINTRFLRFWLNSPTMARHLHGFRDGSVAERLNMPTIRALPIPVLSLREQNEIANLLGALDDKIELNRRMNETLEAMARATFKDWFVDFGPTRAKAEGRPPYLAPHIWSLFPDRLDDDDKPEGWERASLDQLLQFNPSEKLQGGTPAPYLEMADLPTSGAIPESPILRAFTSGAKFRRGDALLARITPCLENGKTCFVQDMEPEQVGWGSTEFIVMRSRPPIPPSFSYLVARDPSFREHAIQSMTGTSGRQRARTEALESYPFPRPDQHLWAPFGSVVDPIFKTIGANGEESRTLAPTRDLLLPKLMSGEIRLRDAEKAVEAVA